MSKKKKHQSDNPIEIFRRSLGLSYEDMAFQIGFENGARRLKAMLKSRECMALVPFIRERWGIDLTSKVIASLEKFFSKLHPVVPEEWMKTRTEREREEECHTPARDPYDPEDDLEEMVNTIEEML